MNLVTIPTVIYRCTTCSAVHEVWPEGPCCAEPDGPDASLLTIAQVAERVQVAKSTVQSWIAKKLLPAVRVDSVVRVRGTDLEDFLVDHVTQRRPQ